MSFRLWYPQLDIYDSIRRMICILSNWSNDPLSPERLSILDFYLANPPLLHPVNMTQPIRDEFQKLRIPGEQKEFLSYPAAPILFHKMEEIQKGAIRTLAGKNLIEQAQLARNEVILTASGEELANGRFSKLMNAAEEDVLNFLTLHLGIIGLKDIRELRRRTGLRRAI